MCKTLVQIRWSEYATQAVTVTTPPLCLSVPGRWWWTDGSSASSWSCCLPRCSFLHIRMRPAEKRVWRLSETLCSPSLSTRRPATSGSTWGPILLPSGEKCLQLSNHLLVFQVHDIFHPFIQTSDDEITFITVNESKTGFCHLYKITTVLQQGRYNWAKGYTHSEGNVCKSLLGQSVTTL